MVWNRVGLTSNLLSREHWRATERDVKVPSEKGLFIRINDVVASEAGKPGATVENLHALAKDDQDSATNTYLKMNDQEFKFKD